MSDTTSKDTIEVALYLAWQSGKDYQEIVTPSGRKLYIRIEENVSMDDASPREWEFFLNTVYV